MMIFFYQTLYVLQYAAILVLVGACFYWLRKKRGKQGCQRFLLPYILVAGSLALLNICISWAGMFVAYYYSGSNFGFGTDWPLFILIVATPLLPLMGIIPAIGNQPKLMLILSVIAGLPLLTDGYLF